MIIQKNLNTNSKKWYQNKKNRLVAGIIGILILLIAVSGVGVFAVTRKNNQVSDGENTPKNVQVTNTPTPTEIPKPKYVASPINGKMIESNRFAEIQNRPPLAVVVQNHSQSRPQRGVNEADVVYETLAEGGITRWIAIFWSQDADRVMSVRSLRKYFADITGDYKNVVLMHIGYAEGANNVNALGSVNANRIRNLGTRGDSYFRDQECQKSRAIEHCAYTTTQTLWDLAQKNNWTSNVTDTESWLYKEAGEASKFVGTDLIDFNVNFNPLNAGEYDVNWKYDAVSKNYKRYMTNGTKYVDDKGAQLYTDVVIYQKITSYLSGDAKNHIVQDVIGSGEGYVMQDGKVYPITWKKPNYATKTRFYDKVTGEEFVFNRGKIWVELVAKNLNYTQVK